MADEKEVSLRDLRVRVANLASDLDDLHRKITAHKAAANAKQKELAETKRLLRAKESGK